MPPRSFGFIRFEVQEADQESSEGDFGQTHERLTDFVASNVMLCLCKNSILVEVSITGKVDQCRSEAWSW